LLLHEQPLTHLIKEAHAVDHVACLEEHARNG
jgi:hypothetical protein